MANTTGARNTLRFQRVTTICAAAGALPAAGESVASAGCNTAAGRYTLACATTVAAQHNYFAVKCPATGLNVETCYRQNEYLDTVLLVFFGSVHYNMSTGQCAATSPTTQV